MSNPSNPSPDELRSMLEPWLVHGRSHMSASVEDSAQAEDLVRDFWIDWRAPAESSGNRNGVMDIETMELLDLFVRVDYDAAWATILKELRLSMCLPEVLETRGFSRQLRLYPRFRIVKLETSSSIVFVQRFGVATEVFDHTPMFYAVRQAFLQAWADRHNGGNGASSPRPARDRIPVMFDLDFSRVKDCHEAHAILGHVGTLAALVDDPSRVCVLNGGDDDAQALCRTLCVAKSLVRCMASTAFILLKRSQASSVSLGFRKTLAPLTTTFLRLLHLSRQI